MYAIIGVLLLVVTGLFFTWAYYQYRRPHPSGWTTWEFPAQAICLVLLAGIGFGLGFIGRSVVALGDAPFDFGNAGIVVMIAAAGVAGFKFLKARSRRLFLVAEPTVESVGAESIALAFVCTDPSEPETPPRIHTAAGSKRRPRKKAA